MTKLGLSVILPIMKYAKDLKILVGTTIVLSSVIFYRWCMGSNFKYGSLKFGLSVFILMLLFALYEWVCEKQKDIFKNF